MKKIIFLNLLAVAIFTSGFSAFNDVSPEKVNYRMLLHFTNEFGNVENVKWTIESNFTKASFVYNNTKKEAYYNVFDEFIGTGEPVSIDEIPVWAKRAIAKKFSDYTVKEV